LEFVSGAPILEAVFASLIAVHETVCFEATDLETEIWQIAKESPLARRFNSVPRVDRIVAHSFIGIIEDVRGFGRTVDVGA